MSAMWLKEWSTQFAWFREHGWRGMGRAGAIAAIAVVPPVIVVLVAITITTSQEPERGPGFALGVESYFTGSAHLEMTWGQHRRVACDYALTMHQRYAEMVDRFDAEEFATGCAGPEEPDATEKPLRLRRYLWITLVRPLPPERGHRDGGTSGSSRVWTGWTLRRWAGRRPMRASRPRSPRTALRGRARRC